MPAELETPFRVTHRACRCDDIPKETLFEWVDEEDDRPRSEGDDGKVRYEIPEHFEAHVSLDYLEILESRGGDAAFRWAVIKCIGRAGWAAMRSPGMDPETFQKLAQVILDRVRGAQRTGPKDRS